MRWLLLLGLWLCYFSFGAIAASIAPLAPVIQADLHLSHAAMGSIMGAWQFIYIISAIPAGLLLDRLGSRSALIIGVGFIATSALARAAAEDYWQLLGAVMLFGLGGPIVSSGAPKVVTDIFSGSQRGLAMGIYMTGPTLGAILALTLTHSLLLPAFDHDWRQVMRLWSGVALLAALAWLLIASLTGQRIPGFVRQPQQRRKTAGSGIIFQILNIPGVTLVLAMSVGVFLINHGLNNWLPELLRQSGMTFTEAGYWAALPMLVGIAGSLTIPRLATPPRRFRILMTLCIGSAITSVMLTLTAVEATAVALVVQGLVRSSLMTVLVLTLMELPDMNPQHTGTASGLFFSAAEVGGVLGPLGMGVLYDLSGDFDLGLYAFCIVALAMAVAATRLKGIVEKEPGSSASAISERTS